MPAAADDFAIVRFSTDTLPERDRVPMLRDFIGPRIARFEIEPTSEASPHFELAARASSDLVVSTINCSALRARRTAELIADGNDNYSISPPFVGNMVGYRQELTPAGAAGSVLSLANPFECACTAERTRFITVSVPRKIVVAAVPQIDDRIRHGLFPDSEALRLLRSYTELLYQDQQLTNANLRRLVVTHVHDLVALALGASRDAAEIANGRGLRAARLHAIKADIRASLGEQDLSLTAVAARHSITPRYVQALFTDEGLNFSQFLLNERLARAYRMLSNPSHMARSISAIAYDAASAISPTSTGPSVSAMRQPPPTCVRRQDKSHAGELADLIRKFASRATAQPSCR